MEGGREDGRGGGAVLEDTNIECLLFVDLLEGRGGGGVVSAAAGMGEDDLSEGVVDGSIGSGGGARKGSAGGSTADDTGDGCRTGGEVDAGVAGALPTGVDWGDLEAEWSESEFDDTGRGGAGRRKWTDLRWVLRGDLRGDRLGDCTLTNAERSLSRRW